MVPGPDRIDSKSFSGFSRLCRFFYGRRLYLRIKIIFKHLDCVQSRMLNLAKESQRQLQISTEQYQKPMGIGMDRPSSERKCLKKYIKIIRRK